MYRFFADFTAIIHLLFIFFVLFGGFFVLRHPRLAWAHIPATLWGGSMEIGGWVCPLTYLENYFRHLCLQAGYGASFVDHYILPIIYPALWFGDFPRGGFVVIGMVVLGLNMGVYWFVWKRH